MYSLYMSKMEFCAPDLTLVEQKTNRNIIVGQNRPLNPLTALSNKFLLQNTQVISYIRGPRTQSNVVQV